MTVAARSPSLLSREGLRIQGGGPWRRGGAVSGWRRAREVRAGFLGCSGGEEQADCGRGAARSSSLRSRSEGPALLSPLCSLSPLAWSIWGLWPLDPVPAGCTPNWWCGSSPGETPVWSSPARRRRRLLASFYSLESPLWAPLHTPANVPGRKLESLLDGRRRRQVRRALLGGTA